jgi:protein gp37
MAGETAIEWTRGDDGSPGATWNPVSGCTKVSAGCDHCYAERFAERFRGAPGHPYEQGFDLKLWPVRLGIPLRWTRPRRIFVNSMADLWHAGVPDEFILNVFAVMANAPQHTFQILTKRPQRMARFVSRLRWRFAADGFGLWGMECVPDAVLTVVPTLAEPHLSYVDERLWVAPNIWLGVSVESQDVAWRIDWLVKTPAAVRFLSCEPLIGALDLSKWLWDTSYGDADLGSPVESDPSGSVHWVIAGGESGPGFRPVDLDWVRALRDQCVLARVPFFYKQQGGIRAKAGGRVLDGRTWDEFPAVAS